MEAIEPPIKFKMKDGWKADVNKGKVSGVCHGYVQVDGRRWAIVVFDVYDPEFIKIEAILICKESWVSVPK